MFELLILAALLAAAGALSYKSYKRLSLLKDNLKSAFRDIDTLLRRRYELIPEFVDALRGQLRHERETLNDLLNSRERANLACLMASGDPANPEAAAELNEAESELRGALRHLMAVVEYYPALKAKRRVAGFIAEFEELENRIANACRAYNIIANDYNRINDKMPFVILAPLLRCRRVETFWAGRAPAGSEPAPTPATTAKPRVMARRAPASKVRGRRGFLDHGGLTETRRGET